LKKLFDTLICKMFTLVASCLLGSGFASSLETRLERVLEQLEDEVLHQKDDVTMARGARAALDLDMLTTPWKKSAFKCHKRSVEAACPTLSWKDMCQASFEARSMVHSGVQIKGAKCVWCENGCTPGGAKCEPKNWLEQQPSARDYEICPQPKNPYHTYTTDWQTMASDIVDSKSYGGTGGLSKCYSDDSCKQILITQNGWITSPRCTTCGRRRADLEYVTMTLEVPSSWFMEKDDRRRFHNPTFQEEEMQVVGFMVKYLKARDGRMCQTSNTELTCKLNADICIRMECDGMGFKEDWSQQTGCAAGFIRTMCVV